MLETLDLALDLPKATYKEDLERLGIELQILQRWAFERGIPVLIVFEGWDAAGKGDAIAYLVRHMDPRGFKVHMTRTPTEEERYYPFLWRFWNRLPGKGEVAIFDRSWYYALYEAHSDQRLKENAWHKALEEVKDFERQLSDSGTLILKFWLHISKKEQKKRMEAWAKDQSQDWRVSERDWETHRRYDRILEIVEEMLALSHTHQAPWVLVEGESKRYRRVKVLSEVVASLRRRLQSEGVDTENILALHTHESEATDPVEHPPDPLESPPPIPLDSPLARVDLSLKIGKSDYQKRLETAQDRLRELGFLCYKNRRPVVFVFEGWDAGGKGGAIKRLTEKVDPRGYTVLSIAAPKGAEATHHYLWRFWRQLPKDGHLAIFDRSWYGRVLVERVEAFCTEPEWRRAYQEINEFEYALSSHGAVVLKFWLEISPKEQLRRFERRLRIPYKLYKITEEDWRNRAKWPQYMEAVGDMLRQTSTPYAPWIIVEAEDKKLARVKILETTVSALEAALGHPKSSKK